MKFRTLSRINYLKKARHRSGHGIHSPFLFQLITTVIEDKRRLPVYKFFKKLNSEALHFLENFPDQELAKVCHQLNLPDLKPRKLYKRVELPIRYGKVVFRLIREFRPSSVINYGPTLGTNLTVMAMADDQASVYQIIDYADYQLFIKEILKDSPISNIYLLPENSEPSAKPELIMINYLCHHERSRSVVHDFLRRHKDTDILIIRGIHESKEMETIWHELIVNKSVRVSLDLFEIGIALFRKGLQKENFIHRF